MLNVKFWNPVPAIILSSEFAILRLTGGSSSFTFCWSSKLCVPSLPSASEAVLAKLDGKEDPCPRWEERSRIHFALSNRASWNEQGHQLPHWASGRCAASTVYIHPHYKTGLYLISNFYSSFLSGLEPGPKSYCIWRKPWQEQLFPVRCHSPSSRLLFSSLSLRQHLFGSLSAQWHCAICSHLPEY